MARRRSKKYGFSFSAKRALGISSMKGRIARATGIPTTRQGRQRKIGRILTGNSCILAIAFYLLLFFGMYQGITLAILWMR